MLGKGPTAGGGANEEVRERRVVRGQEALCPARGARAGLATGAAGLLAAPAANWAGGCTQAHEPRGTGQATQAKGHSLD